MRCSSVKSENQNDLKELWSLLNLLLPEVFDNCKAFHDWFSKPFQKDASSQSAEDDWLETEKKVIIIHRLHQILEPFMLRRRVEDVEGSLPRKDSIVVRCRMSSVQGAIYDWIKATGSLRLDPEDELQRVKNNPNRQIRAFKTLQNKCMELRKVCNHPLLSYPYLSDYYDDYIVRSCGKLWILDRILVKLHRTGHRILLFSTMTRLLDILEEYLQWRRFVYRRIDGGTSLEDRESAIVDFNSPNSGIFIFLLSIRAAGRGLNLQTADTVVIYDPDANPKNEEQAVARAHRIGQKREVKVIYLEAVVDKISSYQKEDELRSGGMVDSEDDLAGKDRYMGSVESLIRNNIQQYKIDMADEVINAGRFDQRTTQEERRLTLETLLHDEERYQETVHDVPSLQQVNRMIARSEEELELFDQMDEELDWPGDMVKYDEIPKWLHAGSKEVNSYIALSSKKSLKGRLVDRFGIETDEEILSGLSPSKPERKRGRPRGSTKKFTELDDQLNYDENGEDFEESSEERNPYASEDEEEETREFEDEDFGDAGGAPPKDQSEGEGQTGCDGGGYDFFRGLEDVKGKHASEEAVSSGSSSDSRRASRVMTPTISSQKFGSLSALDARPGSLSKRMPEELEEGEIAVSGDSHMDLQQSGSWVHDRDDGEDEQVLQPTIRRKRSIRIRPRTATERLEEKSGVEKHFLQHGNPSQLLTQVVNDYETQLRPDAENGACNEPVTQRRNFPSRRATSSSKAHTMPKPSRLNSLSGTAEDGTEFSRESWDGKAIRSGGPAFVGGKMSDVIQRKFKNVLSKLQRAIDKDGHQVAPILTDFWKRNENANYMRGNFLDLRRIDQAVDRLEYNSVMDFAADVQLMLKTSAQYCGFSYEVRSDARKLQALFFDILKAAFPDIDFREATSLVSFSGPGPTAAPSPNQATQTKRHRANDDAEPDPGRTRLLPRGPAPVQDDGRPARGHPSKLQKESRLASCSVRQLGPPDEVAMRTHPGELVICKKRRKDRDKSVVKARAGPPLPAPDTSRSGRGPVQKDPKQSQQQVRLQPQSWPQQLRNASSGTATGNGGGGETSGVGPGGVKEVHWAKPVKKMRTDAGKRRPSHL